MTTQAARGQYGSVAVPAVVPLPGDAVTDRALSLLGLYLQAFVNAYGAVAWQAVSPSTLPIANVFTHDPRKRVFNVERLPALYLFRDGGEPEQVAEDIRVMHARVTALWIFPSSDQEKQRLRDPFSSGLTKLVDDAFHRERDPSFVLAGDTDPNVPDYGSDWQGAAHVDHVWLAKWDRAQVDIKMQDNTVRSYDAIAFAITLNEYDAPSFDNATEPSALAFTTTTPDGAVVTAAYSDAPTPDRLLTVLPNPYHALDAQGRPAGVVTFEPPPGGFDNTNHAGYVGAKIDDKSTVVHDALKPGDVRSPRQDTAYTFDARTPVQVPFTTYYLERLREGSLLPADERTARAAGVKFVAPDEAQAAERDAARERWKAQTGQSLPAPSSASASADNHEENV